MGTRIAAILATGEQYMPRIGDEELKQIVKDAIKEWMDQRLADVGRWTLYGIVVAALGALAIAVLNSNGWHR